MRSDGHARGLPTWPPRFDASPQADPLNGGVVAALMHAPIETGDRSDADHLYREHASALQQADLGDPDDQVEQLHLQCTADSRS